MGQLLRHLREAAMGPAYFYHRHLIAVSKSWSEGEIMHYQEARARRLLARYGNEVRDKAHYRQYLARYNRYCLPGLTLTMHTGGSTGSPLAFAMDTFARRQKERAYIFDIWAELGYKPFDARVVFRGKMSDKLISYNRLENAWIISPSRLNAETREKALTFLRGLRPFFLHVYPGSLFTFIALMGDKSFRDLPILGVMAGSEAFYPGQMAWFEREYGIPVAHWYGHSEYACLARYCRDCLGFHFYPTYGHVEFKEAGEQRARIIATSFNSMGTQFVRYDTGDVVRLSTRTCVKPFLRVDAIEGRVQELFLDRAGHWQGLIGYFFGIHNRFWDLFSAIQFVQREPGCLLVRIVLKSDGDRAWVEALLRERFACVELHFEYVEAIARTETGKLRHFINELIA